MAGLISGVSSSARPGLWLVVMADVLLELANVADDVPVHDLHMVHVKQQLEVGRADLFDGLDAKVEFVALIAGALHCDCHRPS